MDLVSLASTRNGSLACDGRDGNKKKGLDLSRPFPAGITKRQNYIRGSPRAFTMIVFPVGGALICTVRTDPRKL
jgi:hypothetical protein